MPKLKSSSKKPVKELDAKLQQIQQQLVSCQEEDLDKILDSIDTSVSWPKTDFMQWIDVWNRFDAILEQTVSNSLVLSLGEPTPSQKKDKKKPAPKHKKSASVVSITPNASLVIKILNFTTFLLRQVRTKAEYSSIEYVGELLSSEDQYVVKAAVSVLQECVRKTATRNNTAILDGDLPILRKLLILAYGFGRNSLLNTSIESQVTPEMLTKGCSVHFEYYVDANARDSSTQGKSNKKKAEKSKKGSGVTTVVIEDVHKENTDAFGLFKSILANQTIPVAQKYALWTRIRQAYAFKNQKDRNVWNEIRLKSIAILGFVNVSDFLTRLFSYQPTLVVELGKTLEFNNDVPMTIKENVLHVLTSFAVSKAKLQTLLTTLLPTTGTSTYSGTLLKIATHITELVSQNADLKPYDSFIKLLFRLIASIGASKSGAVIINESGLLSQIVVLIGLRKKENQNLTKSCLHVVELMMNNNTSISHVIQAGAVKEAVKIIGETTEELKPLIAQPSASIAPMVQKLLIKSLQILYSAIQARSAEVNPRELLEGPTMNVMHHILSNSALYKGDIYAYTSTILTSLLNNEPTAIPVVLQTGILSVVLKNAIAITDSDSLISVTPLISAFCLNNAALDEVRKSGVYGHLCKVVCTPENTTSFSFETAIMLGKDMNEFMRHHPPVREEMIEHVIAQVSTAQSFVSDPAMLKTDESGELLEGGKKIVKAISNACAIVSQVVSNPAEHSRLFIQKNGLDAIFEASKVCFKPNKTGTIFAKAMVALFRSLSQHQSTPLFKRLIDTLSSTLNSIKPSEAVETEEGLNQIYLIASLMALVFELFSPQHAGMLADYIDSKGKELLLPIAQMDTAVRLKYAAKIIEQREKAKKKKEAEEAKMEEKKAAEAATTNTTTTTTTTANSPVSSQPDDLLKEEVDVTKDKTLYVVQQFVHASQKLYEMMQRAVFHSVRQFEQRHNTQAPTSQAKILANGLAEPLAHLIKSCTILTADFDLKAAFIHNIFGVLYSVIVSEHHRNLNSFVLNSFISKFGGFDALTATFDSYTNELLVRIAEGKILQPKQDKQTNVEKTPEELALMMMLRFFQKLASTNYVLTSPMTASMLLAKKPDEFDAYAFMIGIHKRLAPSVVKFWKNPNLYRLHPDCWVLLINIVAHILKGIEADDPLLAKPKQTAPKVKRVNQAFITQLTEMGFTAERAREALTRCNNDVMAAMEWLLTTPEEEKQPEQAKEEAMEDEDEIAAAIRMSLEESKQKQIDYTQVLRDESLEWITSVPVYHRSLIIPIADVISLICEKQNNRALCLKHFSTKLGSNATPEQLSMTLEVLAKITRKKEMKETVASGDLSVIANVLSIIHMCQQKPAGQETVLEAALNFMEQMAETKKPSIGKDEKITLEKIQTPTDGYLSQADQVKLLELCIKCLDIKEIASSKHVSSCMSILLNLTSSFQNADKARQLGLLEKLVTLPIRVVYDGFTANIESLFRNLMDDETTLQKYIETEIRRKIAISHQGSSRIPMRSFLSATAHLYARNPEIYLKAVKNICVTRNSTNVEFKKDEKGSQELKAETSQKLTDVVYLLLNALITFKVHDEETEKVDKDTAPALEPAALLRYLADFVISYNCAPLLLSYKHKTLEAFDGTNKLVDYLLRTYLCYPAPGQVYKDSHKKQQMKAAKMASYLLGTLCIAHSEVVFNEINNTLRKASQFENPLRFIHGVTEFLNSLSLGRNKERGFSEKMGKWLAANGIANALAESINALELNHPDAPEITNSLLKTLDAIAKTTNGYAESKELPDTSNSSDKEKKKPFHEHIELDFAMYTNEFNRMDRDLLNRSPTVEQANTEQEQQDEDDDDVADEIEVVEINPALPDAQVQQMEIVEQQENQNALDVNQEDENAGAQDEVVT